MVAALVCALFGCNESFKQDAIATDFSDAVGSNGGMAVTYGNYLYFINGYAGSTVDNTFGSVVKGAVARVGLKDGKPDGNPQIIVPKNVYASDKNYGGIYIVNDYIYYATPNTDLNGSGNQKNTEGVIMRTKVDGTDTKTIVKFSDHAAVFRVAGSNLVYVHSNAIHSINLNDKKFADTTVEESILSGYLFEEDYLYYCVADKDNSSNQIMKVYPMAGGEPKVILSDELLKSDEEKETTYTFSLLSAINEGNNVRLFYSKTDSEQNTPEVGVYSTVFNKENFEFKKENEARFTYNTTSTTNLSYTKFYKAGDFYLGLDSSKLDAFNADGSRVKGSESIESLNVGSAVTVFEVETTDSAVYIWYINSSVLYRIKLLEKKDSAWEFVESNAEKIFSGSYDSSYVTLEKIGDVIYYFNTGISNNAFYFDVSADNEDTAKGKILGVITAADIISAF